MNLISEFLLGTIKYPSPEFYLNMVEDSNYSFLDSTILTSSLPNLMFKFWNYKKIPQINQIIIVFLCQFEFLDSK